MVTTYDELKKIKFLREETGQMITLRDLLNQKHLKLLDATRYKLGKSKNEHLNCNLGADTFCQTTVKAVL